MQPSLSLVIGGARSGKSTFAERLVLASGLRPVYLATAEAYDDEMAERIAAHRTARVAAGWITIEEPRDLPPILADRTPQDCVLLDCATLWLSNQMGAEADLEEESARLLNALVECRAPIVVVSNEVGQGIVPENALARRFRDAQGRLNQQLAAAADLAVLVSAGLPLALKGQLPAGLA